MAGSAPLAGNFGMHCPCGPGGDFERDKGRMNE